MVAQFRYEIVFDDLSGEGHSVFTNSLSTAQVVAGQLSIQFGRAALVDDGELETAKIYNYGFGPGGT